MVDSSQELSLIRSTSSAKTDLHTLDSKITQDAIIATNLVDRVARKYMAGGMAVQAYLPSSLYRPTRDVDFTFTEPVHFQDFRRLMNDAVDTLAGFGYSIDVERSHYTFGLLIRKDEERLAIQTRRTSDTHYDKVKMIQDREFESSRPRIVGRTVARVIAPEDLILRKLVRTLRFEQKKDIRPEPWTTDLPSYLDAIKDFRTGILKITGNVPPGQYDANMHTLVETIRLQADLYDIGALIRHAGLDMGYLREGMKDYSRLEQNKGHVFKVLYGTVEGKLLDLDSSEITQTMIEKYPSHCKC